MQTDPVNQPNPNHQPFAPTDSVPDRRTLLAGLGLLTAGALLTRKAQAGPLNPPAGPVISTGKTLTEVEPRIPINATTTPGVGNATFRISQPGSYYLTGNITMTASKHAIGVDSDNVTIDLNGFTITGVANAFNGVRAYGGWKSIIVRNGRFVAMADTAIVLNSDSLAENIEVNGSQITANGIQMGDRGVVRNCRVDLGNAAVSVTNDALVENVIGTFVVSGVQAGLFVGLTVRNCSFTRGNVASGAGIQAGDRLTVSQTRLNRFVLGIGAGDQAVIDRVSIANGTLGVVAGRTSSLSNVEVLTMASSGISVGDSSILDNINVRACIDTGITVTSDCALARCRVSGSVSTGFSATNRNTFTDCTSSRNTGGSGFTVTDGNVFTNCNADENTGDGFTGRFGNIFRSCGARTNSGDGIDASSGTLVLDSRFDGNGNGAPVGANIRLSGDASRIEGNLLVGADFGIQTTSGGNLIIRNSSRNSANAYGGISAGNDVGPIGSAATATSPWANIQF